MELVVLSDLHIGERDRATREPNNLDRLRIAIARIKDAYADADLVVVAGDIADRGACVAPYQAVARALEDLVPPVALTLGNHDKREVFTQVTGTAHRDASGFVQSRHDLGDTQVIIRDTATDTPAPAGFRGACDPNGQLCDTRLAWCARHLQAAADQPVIVILHHSPLRLQIASDPVAPQAPDALLDMLAAHGGLRHVPSGHIHMTTTAFHRGIPLTSLAGNCTTLSEDFGRARNRLCRSGPAQMATVLSDRDQTTVHFDTYIDAHRVVSRKDS